MEILLTLVKIFHVVVSVLLIITVLIQPGKGGDLGSIFGGGSSQSIFGASGAVPFLEKLTRALAVCFIITSLSLAYLATRSTTSSVLENIPPVPVEEEKAPEGSATLPDAPIEVAPQSESSTSVGGTEEQSQERE